MDKTIVIVDDFKTNIKVMRAGLLHKGFKVLEAETPEKALAYFDGRKVDLMVSDFKMPGMTGAELTKAIKSKSNYKYLPVIILSSESNPKSKSDARAAGAYGWLNKPFNMNRFNKIIQAIFE